MSFRAYRLIVEAWRGSRVESRHLVHVAGWGTPALARAEVDLASLPRASMRSTAKPFQLLPLVAQGGAERFELDDADLALMASSHHGTAAHAARAGAILTRLGLGPEALQTGMHRPYFLDALPADDAAQVRIYGPLHHNCSGNHAALLALALLHGVEPAAYLDAGSRSQQEVHRVVRACAGSEPALLPDNCGAPCYDLPLSCIAEAYRLLAEPQTLHALEAWRRELLLQTAGLEATVAALLRIGTAMAARPEWVSDAKSGATRLARSSAGPLVVKHGAEGMLCAAWRDRGASLALKVEDGNSRATVPVFLHLMREFRWLDEASARDLLDLEEAPLLGHRGQAVGRLCVRHPE